MKAHMITVLVIDHEETGSVVAADLLCACPHLCASPVRIQTADIGEWEDSHPLNQAGANMDALDWTDVKVPR